MASVTAKQAAGTYVPDRSDRLEPLYAYLTEDCRSGYLSEAVRKFCTQQPEILDPEAVIVETLSPDSIRCVIPCRCYDHESDGTFEHAVQFSIHPITRAVERF